MIIIDIDRIYQPGDATIGLMKINNEPLAFTLEDIHRDVKVAGGTRIPAGRYEVKYRKVMSDMTTRYRSKYPWFSWHLHLQDVPGFENVYIHIGNYPKNTEGCILVAKSHIIGEPSIQNSTPIFKKLYLGIKAAFIDGHRVFINIK